MSDETATVESSGQRAAARLDTFVDAAFGFAVSLLIISGGAMPATGAELANALLHIPAFLLSFAVIVRMWLSQRAWSARFGLYDTTSTVLNLLLVALVLIFIFPLHAMFEAFAAVASNYFLPSRFQISSLSDLRIMYTAFGAMFVAFGIVLAAMHLRAWELRKTARYSQKTALEAAGDTVGYVWMALVGLASIVLTQSLLQPGATMAEVNIPPVLYFLLFLIGPLSRAVTARLGASS